MVTASYGKRTGRTAHTTDPAGGGDLCIQRHWHGNFYALPLTVALGLEPTGLLRIGLLHYNTEEEIDRLLECLLRIVTADKS